jgi:hypothetical protein
MASPTLSGKHSHRGACNASYSGHCLIVAHLIWREPRAPVLLLEQAGACDQQKSVDPCSYFWGRGYLVWNKPNGARASCSPTATWAGAWGKGRSRRCAVQCFCTKGWCLRIEASRMLAVQLVVRHQMERGFATRLLQHGPVLNGKGAAGTARSSALAPKGGACGNGRAGCSRSDWGA